MNQHNERFARATRGLVCLLLLVGPGSGFADRPSLYGMRMETATQSADHVRITTTGATYLVTDEGVQLWRRIDPATNTINPRQVAELTFGDALKDLRLVSSDSSEARVSSRSTDFVFYSDGLFLMIAKHAVTFTHRNLIPEAPWNKGDQIDRIWTDGYGGSLLGHYTAAEPGVVSSDTDQSTLALAAGDTTFHMAFPSKPFDFDGLYGEHARPLPLFVSGTGSLDAMSKAAYLEDLAAHHFGVIHLYNTFYQGAPDGRKGPAQPFPKVLPTGVLGYQVAPRFDASYRRFIRAAQAHGFKVITYLFSPDNRRWIYPEGHAKAGAHRCGRRRHHLPSQFRRQLGPIRTRCL